MLKSVECFIFISYIKVRVDSHEKKFEEAFS